MNVCGVNEVKSHSAEVGIPFREEDLSLLSKTFTSEEPGFEPDFLIILQQYRNKVPLTQKELAKLVKVDKQTIYHKDKEKGQFTKHFSLYLMVIMGLCKYLNLTLDKLIDDDEKYLMIKDRRKSSIYSSPVMLQNDIKSFIDKEFTLELKNPKFFKLVDNQLDQDGELIKNLENNNRPSQKILETIKILIHLNLTPETFMMEYKNYIDKKGESILEHSQPQNSSSLDDCHTVLGLKEVNVKDHKIELSKKYDQMGEFKVCMSAFLRGVESLWFWLPWVMISYKL